MGLMLYFSFKIRFQGKTLCSNHSGWYRISILITEASIASFCRPKADQGNSLQLQVPEWSLETNLGHDLV